MAAAFPYTHYACPCSSTTSNAPSNLSAKRTSTATPPTSEPAEDATFNPHSARANSWLSPLDHLLFCDECDAIRCPKCYTEENISWYCPSCLFEVPSSAVKGDGHRCSRQCYECPICTAGCTIAALPKQEERQTHLRPDRGSGDDERYILQCQYCDWSTLDIGVVLNKPTKVTEQLAKLYKRRHSTTPAQNGTNKSEQQRPGHEAAFTNLTTFYKEQLSESGDPSAQNAYGNSPYSSPANLARIMSLYGGLSVNALKKSREKPLPMREAKDGSEGFASYSLDSRTAEDEELIRKVQEAIWDDTATLDQCLSAPHNYDATLTSELWPTAVRLRTRKGKRCRTCNQILARPDTKVNNLRYKIRILALNHIPRLSIRPLQPTTPARPSPAFRLRPAEQGEEVLLKPGVTQQYVLTIRNPIFEAIKISLATPATTPGRVSSKVTVLCPSFTVGPAGDVWDEALGSSTSFAAITTSARKDGGREAALASLSGASGSESERQPEAGKIWDKTRNSTSVILEIVPGALKPPPSIVPKSEAELAEEELKDDDEVLEVPVYVRAEWEHVINADELGGVHERADKKGEVGEKVRKEMQFWCVLGVGRIGGG